MNKEPSLNNKQKLSAQRKQCPASLKAQVKKYSNQTSDLLLGIPPIEYALAHEGLDSFVPFSMERFYEEQDRINKTSSQGSPNDEGALF